MNRTLFAEASKAAGKEEFPHRCTYDWHKGYDGLLRCHVKGCQREGVQRWLSLGHDVLMELFERGQLQGQALADAREHATAVR